MKINEIDTNPMPSPNMPSSQQQTGQGTSQPGGVAGGDPAKAAAAQQKAAQERKKQLQTQIKQAQDQIKMQQDQLKGLQTQLASM